MCENDLSLQPFRSLPFFALMSLRIYFGEHHDADLFARVHPFCIPIISPPSPFLPDGAPSEPHDYAKPSGSSRFQSPKAQPQGLPDDCRRVGSDCHRCWVVRTRPWTANRRVGGNKTLEGEPASSRTATWWVRIVTAPYSFEDPEAL